MERAQLLYERLHELGCAVDKSFSPKQPRVPRGQIGGGKFAPAPRFAHAPRSKPLGNLKPVPPKRKAPPPPSVHLEGKPSPRDIKQFHAMLLGRG